MRSPFLKCCAETIKKIWDNNGGSMNIVRLETKCDNCCHYIGLTQTSISEGNDFLNSFGITNQLNK